MGSVNTRLPVSAFAYIPDAKSKFAQHRQSPDLVTSAVYDAADRVVVLTSNPEPAGIFLVAGQGASNASVSTRDWARPVCADFCARIALHRPNQLTTGK